MAEPQVRTNGVIACSAMRVCVHTALLTDSGLVSTAALGHVAGVGMGAGRVAQSPPQVTTVGAGSGASHGGVGGSSGRFGNVSGTSGALMYDAATSPGDMGSGGGGYRGGQGGGVLHLQVLEWLQMSGNSMLIADGAAATGVSPGSDGAAGKLGNPGVGNGGLGGGLGDINVGGGSGGGSGGSIYLKVRQISMRDEAKIKANGGAGAAPGGGGGGGGMVHIEPIEGMKVFDPPLPADLPERIQSFGGHGGGSGSEDARDEAGTDGQSSNFTGFNCTEGYHGKLCAPCPSGHFKSWPGEEACTPCPLGTYQPVTGETSCLRCEVGMVATSVGADACSWCEPGTREAESGTRCVACSNPRFAAPTGAHNLCEWECIAPRMPSIDGSECVLLASYLLPLRYGGTLLLFIPLSVALVFLLAACLVAARRAPKKAGRVEGATEPTTPARPRSTTMPWMLSRHRHSVDMLGPMLTRSERADSVDDGSPGEPSAPTTTRPESLMLPDSRASVNVGRGRGPSPSPPAIEAPSIESLRHALMYEKFKYRAKQHVLRVHLRGRNTVGMPWRLPPLTAELRALVSEVSYQKIAIQFEVTSRPRCWEPLLFSVLSLLPPLAVHIDAVRRRLRWRRVRRLVEGLNREGPEPVWRSMYSRVWEAHRFELGCCDEHADGWLDIFANVSAPLLRGGVAALSRPEGATVPYEDVQRLSPTTTSEPPFARDMRPTNGAIGPGGAPAPPFNSPNASLMRLDEASMRLDASFVRDSGHGEGCGLAVGPAATRQLERVVGDSSAHTGGIGARLRPLSLDSSLVAGGRDHAQASSGGVGHGTGKGTGSRAGGPPPDWLSAAGVSPSKLDSGRETLGPVPSGLQPIGLRMHQRMREAAGSAAMPHHPLMGCSAAPHSEVRSMSQLGLPEDSGTASFGSAAALRNIEPRVSHTLFVCGDGTYLSPYWIELSDFLAYDALSTALDASVATVIACLNQRLATINRYAADWQLRLRETLLLIEAVNAQQADHAGLTRRDPPALALVRIPSMETASASRLILQIGRGDPTDWSQPPGAQLLTPAIVDGLQLVGFYSPGLIRSVCTRVFLGSTRPLGSPRLGLFGLFVLLLTELAINILIVSSLCLLPERATACVATVAVLPAAGILSPFAGLVLLGRILAIAHGVSRGQERSLAAAASGAAVRDLHLGAVWNCASFVNALVAQVAVIPFGMGEATVWRSAQLWLLPLCLMTTKLLLAQAFKLVGTSVGVSRTTWKALLPLERAAGLAPGSPHPPSPPSPPLTPSQRPDVSGISSAEQ